MSAAEVLAQHQINQWAQHDGWWGCTCDGDVKCDGAHQLDALKAAGYAILPPPGDIADNTVEPTPTTTRTTDDMRAEARELARLYTLTENPWIQDLLRDLAIHTRQTADSFDAEAQK